jgi:hypothetical protein
MAQLLLVENQGVTPFNNSLNKTNNKLKKNEQSKHQTISRSRDR